MTCKSLAVIAVAAAFGAAAMLHYSDDNMYPSKKGESFLKMRGYAEVDKGTRAPDNACGNAVFGRTYNAIAPTGNRDPRTVCYSGLGLYMAASRP